MISCLRVKKCEDNNQALFTKNGRVLLEELVTFSNGRSNPILHFSAKELLTATNNYDSHQIVVYDAGYILHKGALKDLPVLVKDDNDPIYSVDPYKDIAIGSQMSVHKNVFKVIGCCLETKKPITVYEFVGKKKLFPCISATNVQPLPWKCKLKITADIANAIAYLHTSFCRPVIHRDIKSSAIILDQNNVPKLIAFDLCISIPEGESHVEDDVIGRTGWGAPKYHTTGYLMEKANVYQFGILLLKLLSGQKPIYTFMDHPSFENFSNVVDPRITQEGFESEHLQDFETLVLEYICIDGEKRPTMIEVAKELRRIYQLFNV